MLLVKTTRGPSKVHGIGLFAAERIPIGTTVWRYVAGHDMLLSREQFEALAPAEKLAWEKFAYVSRFSGMLVCSGDDYVFMNHSHKPNIVVAPFLEPPEGCDIAMRDIEAGEELLFDYTWFGEDPCCRPDQPRLPLLAAFI